VLPADALSWLPHRPPMRLVERVLAIEPGVSARTERRVGDAEWFFDGHFPGLPVVPAIVLIELIAQTGGLAACSTDDGRGTGVQMRLAAVRDFKFPEAAGPRVTLLAEARVTGRLGRMAKIEGRVTADGRLVAAGSVMLSEVD
jgi:3-hydroxyacyl-[acyl-carrier-protein] dehydratase